MRSLLGVIAGVILVLTVAVLLPPENDASAATPAKAEDQTIETTVLQPVAADQVSEDAVVEAKPAAFDPRAMTVQDLKQQRAVAVAAGKAAAAADARTALQRLQFIKAYGLDEARDAAFNDTARSAAKKHRLACLEADNSACLLLGNLYLIGAGVDSDQPLAVALYTLACDDGYQHACMMVEKAQYSYTDRSSVLDQQRLTADEVAAVRAARRETVSVLEDALADHNEDFRPDYFGRVTRVKDGCRADDTADCVQLGHYYYSEYASSEQWGVKHDVPDLEAGRALYLHACDLGDAIGCWNYAQAHYGMGDKDQPEVYLAYFGTSCDMGFGPACQQIASNHERGNFVPEDEVKAAAFLNKGCDLGDMYSCQSLVGVSGIENPMHRASNDLRACLHGYSQACEFMADDFVKGRDDFPKDLVMARTLLTIGCEDDTAQKEDADDRDACKALARLN